MDSDFILDIEDMIEDFEDPEAVTPERSRADRLAAEAHATALEKWQRDKKRAPGLDPGACPKSAEFVVSLR